MDEDHTSPKNNLGALKSWDSWVQLGCMFGYLIMSPHVFLRQESLLIQNISESNNAHHVKAH